MLAVSYTSINMAGDEEFESAVEKGSKLLQMLTVNSDARKDLNPPRSSAPSLFNEVVDLTRYGYEKFTCETAVLHSLSKSLKALGIDDKMKEEGGHNVHVCHKHGTTRVIEDFVFPVRSCLETLSVTPALIKRQKTNALFSQICNPTDGVLIADSNFSPRHAGRLEGLPVTDLQPLQHWSDVAFLQYMSSCPEPTSQPLTLKYVFRATIQNVPTYSILNKILTKHNRGAYETWPGMTFGIDSEEAREILGTPNGSGVAWLLIQHTEQLSCRQIEKVTIFCAENEHDLYRWPSLLFWIV